jgi:sphinganine-1-phosphate aldolase
MPLPAHGLPADEVLARVDAMAAGDVDWRGGRAFTLAYYARPEVEHVADEAARRFLSTNALNPAAFPSLGRMQADVVRMVADLLNGDEGAAGFMTSGGTESILLAVEAARERGRALGVTTPRMVLPTTAHAAFTKAAHYFGVEAVRVPVDADFRADPAAMADAAGPGTVLVVASAPGYPQGVLDPVADVAAVARAAGANCHVDACMGGMTLPYLERLGHPVEAFDFRVPGVTSMSVDLHKYGYAAKGASVIVHRDRELRRFQTFSTDDWLGGRYASPGVLGTRSGAPIASAWAVMHHLGDDGYLRLAAEARSATEALLAGLAAVPGASVLGRPVATHAAFTFEDADPFAVGRALWERGWFVDQQQPPPSLHCTVHAGHRPVVGEFLDDLAAAVAGVRATGATAEAVPYAAAE